MSTPPGRTRGPVAYVMSRFPKLTETFVLYEILALEADGLDVRVFPLLRERQPLAQPEAEAVVRRATWLPFVSGAIVRSNLALLATRPTAYLGALATLVRETAGSPNYLFGGLAIFPKVVHIARLMERARVVHVHCHFSNHPAAAGLVIHRLTGIPFSFTAHGSDLHVDRHMLCTKVAESAFAVAISEENRRVMERECGAAAIGRVDVIHCGVDTDAIRPAEAGSRGRSRIFSILSVGTLHAVKGQAYLVEACRILAEEGVAFECRFVGDGPDEPILRALIDRYDLSGLVQFSGRRTRDEIVRLMQAADVVVAPSVPTPSGRREGIPVVLIEAMAAGTPVVASRLSGIPELVEDGVTGLLAPPRDAVALAAAIRRLHDDPALGERLAAAGRDRVVRAFDLRTNARRLAARFFPVSTEASARAPARGRRPVGFTVALVGPDGAGKTTVGRRLLDELPVPTAYLYMGVNPASANRVLPTTRLVDLVRRRNGNGHVRVERDGRPAIPRVPVASPPRSGVRTAARAVRAVLRVGNRLAEEWYRQLIAWSHLRRGRVVIFDRHFYSDYWATDVAAPRPELSRRIHGLILDRVYPKPDLVVYLDAPPEVLLARKGEGTLESLARKREEYLELGKRLPHFAVVDATAPEAEVVAATREAILAYGEPAGVASR